MTRRVHALSSRPNANRIAAPSAPATMLIAMLAVACLLAGLYPNWNIDTDQRGNFWNHMALAENLSPAHGFGGFHARARTPEGVRYLPYNRFPVLGHLLVKLATLPFPDDAAARIRAARALMLAFFAGAAGLAWLALRRLMEDEWSALAATTLAFSSFHALFYADFVLSYAVVDLLAVMLAFHGVAVFAATGKFVQLPAKVCAALLLGWHVFALIAPFALGGLAIALWRRDWGNAGRHIALGAVAMLFGAGVLGVNIARERALVDGAVAAAELPSFRSLLRRSGVKPVAPNQDLAQQRGSYRKQHIDWARFPAQQLHRVALATAPYAVSHFAVDDPVAPGAVRRGLPGFAAAGAVFLLTTLVLTVRVAPRRPAAGRNNGGRGLALAALASTGPVWALVLRHNTHDPVHDFEGLFHIGLPLAFFALTAAAAPATSRRAIGLGGAAVFALSATLSTRALWNPAAAETTRAQAADLDAALAVVQDADVLTPASLPWMVSRYLLRGVVQVPFHEFGLWPLADYAVDKRLAPGGAPIPSPTPNNRLLFLYKRADFEKALERYAALAAGRAPEGQAAAFDIHYLANSGFGDDLLYVRRDCRAALRREREPRFFAHVYPSAPGTLGRRGEPPADFANLNFSALWFWRAGNRCYAARRLPDYAIASIHTGQFKRRQTPPGASGALGYENQWEVRFSPPAAPSGGARLATGRDS